MRNYLIRRLLQLIPVIIGITFLQFAIIQSAPGDPISLIGGDNPELRPEQIEKMRQEYGLDQPLPVQYVKWLGKVVRGNFGNSYIDGRPVMEVYLERLPNTIYLNLFAISLIYLLAIPIGVFSALRQYSKFDYTVTVLAFAGDAMPGFFLALLAIYLIALPSHGVIPVGGIASYGMKLAKVGLLPFLLDRARYLLLPLLVMVAGGLTGLTRFMRTAMLEVIREDYVRTARAKGLAERVVIYKHAMRNALIPIITLAGAILPGLFGGAVIIEQIFSWPGVGLVGYRAIMQRDYPVVMAFMTIGAGLTIISFLLVDLLYAVVDPRIKYS